MIGIIDSGFGGLSVVAEVFAQQKKYPFVYFGDNANNPYGTKSQEEITACAYHIIDHLHDNYGVTTVFIACNTMCSASFPDLVARYPHIHFENVAKYGAIAAQMTFNNHVTVLATNFTAKSHLYKRYIQELDPEIHVQELPAQDFVQQVESGVVNMATIKDVIQQVDKKSDVLVLGCTHYPFLYNQIRELLSEHIQIVDPAVSLVASCDYPAVKDWEEQSVYLTSGSVDCFGTFLKQHNMDQYQIKIKKV